VSFISHIVKDGENGGRGTHLCSPLFFLEMSEDNYTKLVRGTRS